MSDETESRLGSVEYDPATDAYYTNYGHEVAPPSVVVPGAIAEITGRTVETLEPLQKVIDTDALDHLFGDDAFDSSEEAEVSFTYAGHEVYVNSSGVVVIEPVACEE